MTAAPLVSVIMPVHNGARFLREALESALAQTYRPIEIIVVDDGSTDHSAAILQEYASRITAINQANQGAAVARNVAIAASRGELLAFLDADDLWAPHKLEVQVAYLQARPHVDLIASRWQVLAAAEQAGGFGASIQSATPDEAASQRSEWIYNELLMDCIVHTTTVLMRRSLVDKIGVFDVSLRRGQDYDYWLRASRATPIHRLDAPLSCYRLHEANSTWRPQPLNYAALVLERALKMWGRKGPDGRVTPRAVVRRRLSQLWFSFGYQHASNGSVAIATGAALRSARAWPLYAKPWLLLALCALAPIRRALRAEDYERPPATLP